MFNSTLNMDYAPIQVILTDSVVWEFYYFDFSRMHIWRGSTSRALGFRTDGNDRITVPMDEDADEFFMYMKIGKNPYVCNTDQVL